MYNRNYDNLICNYNLLYLDYLIKSNNYIIFFNYNRISSTTLLNIKNEISKIGGLSLILNTKNINKLFSVDLYFLKGFTVAVFLNDFIKFIKVINELNFIYFYFAYKKRFSLLLNKTILLDQCENFKNCNLLHFIIFKIIFNIIIIILYFITLFIKYLK